MRERIRNLKQQNYRPIRVQAQAFSAFGADKSAGERRNGGRGETGKGGDPRAGGKWVSGEMGKWKRQLSPGKGVLLGERWRVKAEGWIAAREDWMMAKEGWIAAKENDGGEQVWGCFA
jgi:hypothetical protein